MPFTALLRSAENKHLLRSPNKPTTESDWEIGIRSDADFAAKLAEVPLKDADATMKSELHQFRPVAKLVVTIERCSRSGKAA